MVSINDFLPLIILFVVGVVSVLSLVFVRFIRNRLAALGQPSLKYDRIYLSLSILALVCGWYFSALSLTLSNKMLLNSALALPVLLTTLHMIMKGVLALLVIKCVGSGSLRYKFNEIVRSHRLSKQIYMKYLVSMGVATALDVWLSNESLRYLDVTRYATLKSCSIVFNLLSSILMKLLKPSVAIVGSVLLVGGGVILTSIRSEGAIDLNPFGVFLVLLAAFFSSSRWVITECYMQVPGVNASSIVLVALQAPATIFTLLPLLIIDLIKIFTDNVFSDSIMFWKFMGAMLLGGVAAFVLVASEVALVGKTSALTLSVIGHMKECVLVFMSVMIFHDVLSPMNWIGVAVTMIGAIGYSYFRKKKSTHMDLPPSDIALQKGTSSLPPSLANGHLPATSAKSRLDLEFELDAEDESGLIPGLNEEDNLLLAQVEEEVRLATASHHEDLDMLQRSSTPVDRLSKHPDVFARVPFGSVTKVRGKNEIVSSYDEERSGLLHSISVVDCGFENSKNGSNSE